MTEIVQIFLPGPAPVHETSQKNDPRSGSQVADKSFQVHIVLVEVIHETSTAKENMGMHHSPGGPRSCGAMLAATSDLHDKVLVFGYAENENPDHSEFPASDPDEFAIPSCSVDASGQAFPAIN